MARNKISKAFGELLVAKGMIPPPPEKGTLQSVVLPIPPSTNELFWARGNGRTKTTKYKDWIADALPFAEALMPPKEYPAMVVLTIEAAVNTSRDADNFAKPTCDLLKTARVIKDDCLRYITDVVIRYRPKEGGTGVRVHFEAVPVVGE